MFSNTVICGHFSRDCYCAEREMCSHLPVMRGKWNLFSQSLIERGKLLSLSLLI